MKIVLLREDWEWGIVRERERRSGRSERQWRFGEGRGERGRREREKEMWWLMVVAHGDVVANW